MKHRLRRLLTLAGALVTLGLVAGACEAHSGMTTQQTVNYHCEKTDHGAVWLWIGGDGSIQLSNWEANQYRDRTRGTDRCMGTHKDRDGYVWLIAYDVNYNSESITKVWVADVWYPSPSLVEQEPDLTPGDPTLENLQCVDTTQAEKDAAAAAGITLPPECYGQTIPGAGETVAQFLTLDPAVT